MSIEPKIFLLRSFYSCRPLLFSFYSFFVLLLQPSLARCRATPLHLRRVQHGSPTVEAGHSEAQWYPSVCRRRLFSAFYEKRRPRLWEQRQWRREQHGWEPKNQGRLHLQSFWQQRQQQETRWLRRRKAHCEGAPRGRAAFARRAREVHQAVDARWLWQETRGVVWQQLAAAAAGAVRGLGVQPWVHARCDWQMVRVRVGRARAKFDADAGRRNGFCCCC